LLNSFDSYSDYSSICSRIREVIRQDQIEGGIKKIHVLLYYQSIANYILPYLKDRLLGLNVVTQRWAGDERNLFLRNIKGYYHAWVQLALPACVNSE
jgi:hypothetical protein